MADFFVAKRAAYKLKRFWKRHMREQAKKADDDADREKEEKKAAGIAENNEMLRRSFVLKKQATRKLSENSVSPEKKEK